MQLMQSTGNPLLDMYANQYAAMGYTAGPAAGPTAAQAVSQAAVMPAVTQSLSLDASQAQANAAVAGNVKTCHFVKLKPSP